MARRNMGLGGDSAGANLGLSTALALKDADNNSGSNKNNINNNTGINIKDRNLIRVLYLNCCPKVDFMEQ
ncbi:MAG TPA: hypothetical protein VIR31_01475 [Nitrososphaeraceae archaeon]|jgi:hypothetical protein